MVAMFFGLLENWIYIGISDSTFIHCHTPFLFCCCERCDAAAKEERRTPKIRVLSEAPLRTFVET